MSIRIFVTGGTFDKEYNEIDGTLSFTHTHVEEILKLGRSQLDVRITELMLIDSLDMTPALRERICTACREAAEDQIVITHGTDTMCETARVLAAANLNKTIVLTGAMIPYKFGTSDGLFNMGCALAFAQALPPGVYVAMNGRWFPWDRVRKNRQTGIFEEIEPGKKGGSGAE
ncbi:MAG: asparaginase [Candidatus Neomarinimicrobiota bacterium]|nr:MAG: asparaginase [Candidatus Neomarinimicrobiota bacterium]